MSSTTDKTLKPGRAEAQFRAAFERLVEFHPKLSHFPG